MTWRELLIKDKAPWGEKYLIPLGGCPSWPMLPMVNAEVKSRLKGDDVTIKFSEYIDILGCRIVIIAFGMPYVCSF